METTSNICDNRVHKKWHISLNTWINESISSFQDSQWAGKVQISETRRPTQGRIKSTIETSDSRRHRPPPLRHWRPPSPKEVETSRVKEALYNLHQLQGWQWNWNLRSMDTNGEKQQQESRATADRSLNTSSKWVNYSCQIPSNHSCRILANHSCWILANTAVEYQPISTDAYSVDFISKRRLSVYSRKTAIHIGTGRANSDHYYLT